MNARHLLAVILPCVIAVSGHAATIDVTILIDSDDSSAPGCTVTTAAGTFRGIDHVLTTTVSRSASPAPTTTDADSANLTGATVTISANYANGENVLSFVDTATLSGGVAGGDVRRHVRISVDGGAHGELAGHRLAVSPIRC